MRTLALVCLMGFFTLTAFAADDTDNADTGTAATSSPPTAAKSGQKDEKTPPPLDPQMLRKAQKLCVLVEGCNEAHPGRQAYCLKTSLKDSGLLSHVLGGEQAKDLPRYLRREGFVDVEMGLRHFTSLPDGAILVLDAEDPLRDHRPLCPKVYGNVVVKCGDKWVDDQKNDLDFHMKRGCRTKGIWVHPGLMPKGKGFTPFS